MCLSNSSLQKKKSTRTETARFVRLRKHLRMHRNQWVSSDEPAEVETRLKCAALGCKSALWTTFLDLKKCAIVCKRVVSLQVLQHYSKPRVTPVEVLPVFPDFKVNYKFTLFIYFESLCMISNGMPQAQEKCTEGNVFNTPCNFTKQSVSSCFFFCCQYKIFLTDKLGLYIFI